MNRKRNSILKKKSEKAINHIKRNKFFFLIIIKVIRVSEAGVKLEPAH